MDAASAKKVISDTGLIEGPISRAVLSAIVRDRFALEKIPAPLRRDVAEIAAEYYQQRQAGTQPCRNIMFYQMIKRHYPDFEWEFLPGGVKIDYTYQGIKPSLLSFLLGRVPKLTKLEDPMKNLPREIKEVVARIWSDLDLVTPTEHQRTLFANWLAKGVAGKPLTIVSPVCPDYSIEPIEDATDGPDCRAKRHRFTFKSIGGGLGVTAIHLFEFLPLLHARLKGLGFDFIHWICPGDFEGFSTENCARLGVTEAQFLELIERQTETIRSDAPSDIQACAFCNLCGGKTGWNTQLDAVEERMNAGDLAYLKHEDWVKRTAMGRQALYDRWFPIDADDEDFYIDITLRQGAEYAAMGEIIWSNPRLTNPLVLGADDHKMGQFYSVTSPLPVLYLERRYE